MKTLMLMLILSIGLVSAEIFPTPSVDVGIGFSGSTTGQTGVNIKLPIQVLNSSTIDVNNSNFSNFADIWITAEGYKDDVSDILASEISDDGTYRTIPNTTFTYDINMVGKDIINVEDISGDGNILFGDTGSDHRFYVHDPALATAAHIGIEEWTFVGIPVAEIYGSAFFFGSAFAIRDNLFLHGATQNPELVFANAAGTANANIIYVGALDRMGFQDATGGYAFLDGDVQIDSNTKGVVFGTGKVYTMYSQGTAMVFNRDSKDIDAIFLPDSGNTILRLDAGDNSVCVNCDTTLAKLTVEGDSRFGDVDGSRTQIDIMGRINQIGIANASFHDTVIIEGNDFTIQSDETGSYFQGFSRDVSINFNAFDWIFNAEVGTPNVNWTGFASYQFDNDINQTGGNATIQNPRGEMWFHDDTTSVTTGTPLGVWVNITGFDGGDDNGQILNGFSYLNGTLIAQIRGGYYCRYDISTGNAGNNQEYQFILCVDGVQQNNTDAHRKIGASGDVGNVGEGGELNLSVGSQVTFQARNNDGSASLEVHSAGVDCVRRGDII